MGVTVSNRGCYVIMFNPLLDKGMKAVRHLLSKSKDMVDGGLEVSTLCKYINHYSLLIVCKSDLGLNLKGEDNCEIQMQKD